MQASPRVVVRWGEQSVQIAPGERCVIGRSQEAALQIADCTVSRTHAAVSVSDGRVWVTDLGSKRGTFVNGVQIQGPIEFHAPSTINLGGPEGVPVVIGEDQLEGAPGSTAREPTGTRSLAATLRGRPLIVAGVVGGTLIVVLALVAWFGRPPSPQDQLVLVAIQRATASTQVGTAVIIDGERQLVAVPHVKAEASYLVQVPLDESLVYDVAAVRVAEGGDIAVLQLIGVETVSELASHLDGLGAISLANLESSPSEFWTYGRREDGTLGSVRQLLASAGSGRAAAHSQHLWAFAPVVMNNRLTGFVSAGCEGEDGTMHYDLVEAADEQESLESAAKRADTVGPAPIRGQLQLDYTPQGCE